MNELDLIKEVEKRPILYDKSVSGFNKTKLRDDAWKDVQEALNVTGCSTESECKKRWRSLRDSFIKLQRTHGGRTRWPYHQAMRFLLPHVEPGSQKAQEDPEPITRHKDQPESDSDNEEDRTEVPNLTYNQLPVTYAIDPRNITQLSEDDEDSQPSVKKARLNSTEEEVVCQCNRTDPDELFLLSCSSTLKRLNAKQNAVARLKIQQVLYEAEFGGPGDLPFVTPASDCSFDHLDSTVE
ncbi:transcription factor Adf-1 isoform X1 [Plutella xylostella]|uniref:transcription factor Adf-1 isoform X1 n=1 Tax=Plutella xylostella TaxID=51655 RepID=UPI00203309AD|nr:transcription factor Adf-1 isoform X1 [Plutella xylostella]